MTEKKLKPASKNAATSKTSARKSGANRGKTGTAKTAASAGTQKTASRKSETKTKAPTVTKAPTPASGKKAPVQTAAAASRLKVAPARNTAAKPTPEELYRMVQTAAYFIAERNGFRGNSDEHWAAAEREISARLSV
jgi:hypothetical protein